MTDFKMAGIPIEWADAPSLTIFDHMYNSVSTASNGGTIILLRGTMHIIQVPY